MTRVLHLARFTLEAQTPISLGNGAGLNHDVALVRDANGLPAIPGSSLRGAIRSLWQFYFGGADDVFGYEKRGANLGQRGFITLNFAQVHDMHNKAVCGLHPEAPYFTDSVLSLLAREAPVLREHVELNERGVTKGSNKFDRSAVPRGTRFSFEVSVWKDKDTDPKDWFAKIRAILESPEFRLGGAGRRGYGAVRVVRATHAELTAAAGIRVARGQAPHEPFGQDITADAIPKDRAPEVLPVLSLEPIGMIRVGSGGDAARTGLSEIASKGTFKLDPGAPPGANKEADLAPYTETFIDWTDETGSEQGGVSTRLNYVIPGSSIHGPLVHRALFHYNRAHGHFADPAPGSPSPSPYAARPEDLYGLFGFAKADDTGAAGAVFTSDAVLVGANAVYVSHNAIDRFTGGVITGALYSEEVLVGGTFDVSIVISRRPLYRSGESAARAARAALNAAIDDLKHGRLALGAKSLGFCRAAAPTARALSEAGPR